MKIAIVGATGNVGRKIIEVLEQKKILVEDGQAVEFGQTLVLLK